MSDVAPRRWPLGFAGMLVLVVGIEFGLSRAHEHLTPIFPREWGEVFRGIHRARGSSVVALGDSLIKNGIVPQVVENRLGPGRSVYNLSVSGGPFAVTYFTLRRLVEMGAAPEAVVVDGQTLTSTPFDPNVPLPWHTLGVRDIADVAWTKRDLTFFADNLIRKTVPSVKHRLMIRSLLLATARGESVDDQFHLWIYPASWIRNKGCLLLPDREKATLEAQAARDERIRKNFRGDWKCDPASIGYVERFLALAAESGVRVYWLMLPDTPLLNAEREEDGWWRGYSDFLRGLQSRYTQLIVVDGHRTPYPPEVMNDVIHMSRTGAIALSDALGEVLASSDQDARWVELSRFDFEHAKSLATRSAVVDLRRLARIAAARDFSKSDTILR